VNWIHVAECRKQRRDFMNTIMNLRVSQGVRAFKSFSSLILSSDDEFRTEPEYKDT
jgi:hypothetical protein